MNSVKQNGFTIVELLLTMGIFAILTSLATINLLNAQHVASIDTTVTTLIADLKQQQTKAMTGDTEGRTAPSQYGIHFDPSKYVLFHGSYSTSDTTNFSVNLDGSLRFTGTGDIVFSQVSGEISVLSPLCTSVPIPQCTIVLKDSVSNKQKTITINIYGVIKSVN